MRDEYTPQMDGSEPASDIHIDMELKMFITAGPCSQPTPSWTIENVASELLSLYRFLTRAYLPEWKLRVPPPEGWPQITHERFAGIGKDDIVIELLKHLPYIRCDDFDETMIWTDCKCNDYAGLIQQNAIVNHQSLEHAETPMLTHCGDEPLESHRVVIADVKSRDGWGLVFDTKDGSVLNWSPMYGQEEYFDSMADFVDHVKNKFLSMDVIAVNESSLEYSEHRGEDDDYMEPLRQALLRKEWPGGNFNKAAYLKEAAEIREEWDEEEEEEKEINIAGQQTTYSVCHVAAQLLSLYQFLVRMYLPEDMLRIPPRDGWELISHPRFGDLLPGSSSEARTLLKHLPYIRQDFQDTSVSMITADTVCVDYSGQQCHQYVMMDDKKHQKLPHDPLPAHKIALATDSSGTLNTIVFDTLTGSIERFNGDRRVQNFRCIDDLVSCITQEYMSLQVVPVNEKKVVHSVQGEPQSEKLRAIFLRHGWPSEQYSNHKCLQEVRSAILERSATAHIGDNDTMLDVEDV